MSRPITYHTPESLEAKTIEVGDCWEWQGYFGNKVPSICHGGKMTSVRRLFADLLDLGYPKGGFIVARCENGVCVNPRHFKHYTDAKFSVYRSKRAAGNPLRAAKIQAFKRRTSAKLTQEQADAIRCSDRPSREEAKIYGVDKSLICRIRSGKAWVNLSANPFAGLLR